VPARSCRAYLATGLAACFDAGGAAVPCADSGQDAETAPGLAWPAPRFALEGETVRDALTGLQWSRSANLPGFSLTWPEALADVARLNRERFAGFADWRLPNRRELRSLVDHGTSRPALPEAHPFSEVFLGWYWTSTTSALAPAYAWRVHFEGGRMFYGAKNDEGLLWPVRGASAVLPRTGQRDCFAAGGQIIACAGSGQDGELQTGLPWPEPRFERLSDGVHDRLTGLVWAPRADLADGAVTWTEALEAAAGLARETGQAWRLPTVNELESLVDASRHSPALPEGHPFASPGEAYWSSTSSGYAPDWAYCLYLHKGAVGVGHKPKPEFLAWAVRAP
jgi:hypothetical protein